MDRLYSQKCSRSQWAFIDVDLAVSLIFSVIVPSHKANSFPGKKTTLPSQAGDGLTGIIDGALGQDTITLTVQSSGGPNPACIHFTMAAHSGGGDGATNQGVDLALNQIPNQWPSWIGESNQPGGHNGVFVFSTRC